MTKIELTLGEEILKEHKIIEVRILEVDIEVTLGMITLVEVEGNLEKQYSSNFRRNERSSGKSRSGSRVGTNRDRIRCVRCREYDHFAKDRRNISDTEKGQSEQIQQMLHLEEDKTALKVITANTYEDLIRETIDHLN